MLKTLDYRASELLQALVQHAGLPQDQPLDALDAGCGTGLCGEWLRTTARRLVGVDLSEGMLAQAKARGCYDELLADELTHHLQERPAAYDLIVAADTLNYFGVLDDVFASAAAALRPGGLLAFTLEQGSAADTDWSLQPHGRYCHSEDYLRRTLEQHRIRTGATRRSRRSAAKANSRSLDGLHSRAGPECANARSRMTRCRRSWTRQSSEAPENPKSATPATGNAEHARLGRC